MKFFTKYSRPASAGFVFTAKSMTDQSQRDACDISSIVSRFGLNALRAPDPARFKDVFDLAEGGLSSVMESLETVKDSFMTLNSDLRSKFNNDATQFARFIATGTRSDFEELGLLAKNDSVAAAANAVVQGRAPGVVAPDEGAAGAAEPTA
ncbi:internal scaffolding protein [Sigmofec virus UA08Rod_6051]|uniref:Internal scaffolding protein n=1 Tax=Sigmofec virus UA08Rod_6051 TaxID=2929449 RepID=A0A976N102_9VIRU|nr:internal scaffolding protein [Sigmofec virus UA08Rod_6051]